MIRKIVRLSAPLALVVVAGTTASAQLIGPSTSVSPYLLPNGLFAGQVQTKSILTVNDPTSTVGGYRMVGIPDGLGAFSTPGSSTFTLLMNHELGGGNGIARAHGQTGAFVSRWEINPTTLQVTSGRDHNTSSADAYEWTGAAYSNAPNSAQQWNRFCSGDLAAPTAYKWTDPSSNTVYGTDSRIYMNGEEAGADGRAYAHIVSGAASNQTWQLPALGRFSWENSVASPFAQKSTIVAGLDDSGNGQVYMYIGDKTTSGNDITRAGLTSGNLYGVKINGVASEAAGYVPAPGTRFSLFNQGNATNKAGSTVESESAAGGVTGFRRPEDGSWDPRPGHENDFYYVTTDAFNGRSKLWRMRFDDITNPTSGGTIEALLTGTEGQQMFDNFCIDSHGRILLQEDPGGNDYVSQIWMYDIATGSFANIAQHDSYFFGPGSPGFLTNNEESSGIIDAKDILGDGWFLLDVQAHYGIPGELVEGGQLLAMYVDPQLVPAPTSLALLGLGGAIATRRRRR